MHLATLVGRACVSLFVLALFMADRVMVSTRELWCLSELSIKVFVCGCALAP